MIAPSLGFCLFTFIFKPSHLYRLARVFCLFVLFLTSENVHRATNKTALFVREAMKRQFNIYYPVYGHRIKNSLQL